MVDGRPMPKFEDDELEDGSTILTVRSISSPVSESLLVQPDDEELDPVSSTMEARSEEEEAEEPVSVLRVEYIVAAVAIWRR